MPQLVVLKEEARKAGIELQLEKLDSSAMFKKFLKNSMMWPGWGGAPACAVLPLAGMAFGQRPAPDQ